MALFGLMTQKDHRRELEALKAELIGQLPKWLLETADAEKFNIPDPSVYGNQATLYQKLSWVLQAVDMTASASALSRFDVKRVVRDKEPKDIPNHPFELLLRKPNPLDSRYEFLYGSVAMFMLTGNCEWFLNKEDEYAAPDEMWLIPSHMIEPIPDERLYLKGYLYRPGNGKEIMLEPWQICHFRRFNPFSRFVGMSAIESLALSAAGDLGMQTWNTKYFTENNARLPGILTFAEMIQDDQWKKIKDDTREASKKRELLMLRGVGQGGVSWTQNAISQKEMEFLQGRAFNRDEIWNTLAPGLVSMLSPNSTEANSRTGAAVFNERTVYPKHVLMAEKITLQILPCYGGRELIGEFEDIRITDKQMEMQEQELFAKTHTIAEIREEYYGDKPLGDDRDDLLPAQINANGGGIQEEPDPQPEVNNNQTPMQEMEAADNEPPEEDDTEATQEAMDDLRKWEAKALRSVGKSVQFITRAVPEEIQKYVNRRLPACTSQTAVKAVFDAARADVRPQPHEAKLILKRLDILLKDVKAI